MVSSCHLGFNYGYLNLSNIDNNNNQEVKRMVKIRLKRMGQKKAPFYRIVVADSRSQETESSLKRLEHMIPPRIQVNSMLMKN